MTLDPTLRGLKQNLYHFQKAQKLKNHDTRPDFKGIETSVHLFN